MFRQHTGKATALAVAFPVCLRCVFLRRVVSHRFGASASPSVRFYYTTPKKTVVKAL